MAEFLDYEPGGYPVDDFHLFLRELELGAYLSVAEMVAKYDITPELARRWRTMARRRGVPVTWKRNLKQFFGVAKIVYDHFKAKDLSDWKGYALHNFKIKRGMSDGEVLSLRGLLDSGKLTAEERGEAEEILDANEEVQRQVERVLELLEVG